MSYSRTRPAQLWHLAQEVKTSLWVPTGHPLTSEINVFSTDTDVFVLLLRRYYELCTEVHFVTGTGQRRRVIKLRPIAQTLGRSRLAALPGLHAVSGADVTGSFANKGKLTWWKMFKDANEATTDALSKLGTRGLPTADTMAAIKKLVCRLYVPNTPIKTVSELRWSLFRKKEAQSEKLPPTQAAIREAIMRANCQALIWSLDSVPSPDLPPPQEYGSGLQITAGQRTMSGQKQDLSDQILRWPDNLSGRLRW